MSNRHILRHLAENEERKVIHCLFYQNSVRFACQLVSVQTVSWEISIEYARMLTNITGLLIPVAWKSKNFTCRGNHGRQHHLDRGSRRSHLHPSRNNFPCTLARTYTCGWLPRRCKYRHSHIRKPRAHLEVAMLF